VPLKPLLSYIALTPHLQSALSTSGWLERWQQAGKVLNTAAQAIDVLTKQESKEDGNRLKMKMKMQQAKGHRDSISTIELLNAV
jgi:hypothetical protein